MLFFDIFFEKDLHLNAVDNLKGAEIVGTFYKKELQKTNQKEFRVEKVIGRKADKLYVK